MNLIEFKNVSFSYAIDDDDENQVTVDVLKNFNLTIEKGSFVAILGHNGSGKSTTAKLINGINIAQSGEVIVDGQKVVDDETIFDIRRKVGMVFQNPDNQIVSSIVEEDVAFGVENLGVEPKEIRKRVDNALKTVGMYEYRLKAPNKLSGGQKQRVAVAGIIAMKPMCIVLDEYGQAEGLITLEDIVEEIIGDIHDEFDQAEELAVRKIGDNEYIVEGSINLDDFNDELGTDIDSEDYESLGGLIIEHLDRLPNKGDSVKISNCKLTVIKMDEKRIDLVKVQIDPEVEKTEDEEKLEDEDKEQK